MRAEIALNVQIRNPSRYGDNEPFQSLLYDLEDESRKIQSFTEKFFQARVHNMRFDYSDRMRAMIYITLDIDEDRAQQIIDTLPNVLLVTELEDIMQTNLSYDLVAFYEI